MVIKRCYDGSLSFVEVFGLQRLWKGAIMAFWEDMVSLPLPDRCLHCNRSVDSDDPAMVPVRQHGQLLGLLCGDDCAHAYRVKKKAEGVSVIDTKWTMRSSAV